jgi:hypothetical protein
MGAIEVTARMFATAPLERISSGKNACVTLAQQVDVQLLLDRVEIGQVFENSDACIIDEEVKLGNLIDCPLDLRSVGYVQRERCHAWISIWKCAPSARKDFFRSPIERFFNKGCTEATVGAGDQDCLLRDMHNVLL